MQGLRQESVGYIWGKASVAGASKKVAPNEVGGLDRILIMQDFVDHVMVFEICSRTSLVVQWLRTHLTVQGTRVRALVPENPTCSGATKPVCHSY